MLGFGFPEIPRPGCRATLPYTGRMPSDIGGVQRDPLLLLIEVKMADR